MNLKLKKHFSLLFLIHCFNFFLIAQGQLYLSKSFQSKILAKQVKYSIYLPNNFSETNEYPVIYMLHGYDGDETSWPRRTNLINYIDSLVTNNILPEIIMVFPDGENSYYINNYNNRFCYEDMLINEFFPYIDSTYHCTKNKYFRAIAGLSMGGFGSVVLTLKHPELFGTCINISGAIRTDEQMITMSASRYDIYFGAIYGSSLSGKERITEHFKKNSPYHLIDSTSYLNYINNYWYFDCGQEDFLFTANKSLHELFLSYKISHEYLMRKGVHNWGYWEESFKRAVLYWSDILTKCN